jgi:hypothetical protein
MKLIEEWVALEVLEKEINDDLMVELSFGKRTYEYTYRTNPKKIFATKEEAQKHAYETNKYGQWLIVPIITFDNF